MIGPGAGPAARLEVRGLSKAYGGHPALRGVDLTIEPGQIVCLLGHNGAGKTTLVSVVCGLRRADAGTVRVDGIDALAHPARARRRIGLVPQELGLYGALRVRDNLRLFAELAGLHGRVRDRRIAEVAQALGLTPLLDRRAGTLSGGEKRRAHTAMALVHRPLLLLLDEPTTGSDVETRAALLTLVQRLADEGAGICYSTHYLPEVEALGGGVVILEEGRVIARGGVAELVAAHAQPLVELLFEGPAPDLGPGFSCDVVSRDGPRLRLGAPDPARTVTTALAALGVEAGRLRGIDILRPSLESAYLALTGRRFETAAGDSAP